jgi:putative transposon-encoded protein
MAKNNNLGDFLTDIANAIREKKGISRSINAQNFASEIASISTGGGDTPTPDTPTPDMPVIGDGKTYLYIKIAEKGRMNVPLYFSQTIANGVTIDWGDGSETQTLSGTGNVNNTHTYAEIGEYTISLNPSSGCTLGLGHNSSSYGVMGSTGNNGRVYCNMLQAVEIGKNVTSIGNSAFQNCYSLASVVIPEGVTSIGNSAFQNCYSLASVVIPQGVTSIGNSAFYYCYSLASVVIPEGVTSIGNSAFQNCYGMAFYDFREAKSVPTLGGTMVFSGIPSDCKIVVPDSLYSSWTTATNWSTHASKIVKASEFNG